MIYVETHNTDIYTPKKFLSYPYQIRIQQSDTHFKTTPIMDFDQWCTNTFGDRSILWDRELFYELCYFFKDKRHAALFKLKWIV